VGVWERRECIEWEKFIFAKGKDKKRQTKNLQNEMVGFYRGILGDYSR
jgi:hypothetical protein